MRLFCCLGSFGNPQDNIALNHQRYAEKLWTAEHLKPDGKLSYRNLTWSLMSYPLAMGGYLIEAAMKIVLLISNFIFFLFTLAVGEEHWRRARTIVFLDTGLALVIDVVGCACPPLAYKLHAWAENYFTEWAQVAHAIEATRPLGPNDDIDTIDEEDF